MDLALSLNPQAPISLHQQLYQQIRDAILSGRLRPKQRLPATRALARSLQLSRSTVSLSYERLTSEGYLQTRPGSGTFVCAQLPETLSQPAPLLTRSSPQSPPPLLLSPYGQHLANQPPWQPETTAETHFRYGRSAMEKFPLALWRKLQSRHMQQRDWMDYTQDTQGYAPLREALANYLARSRAVRCTPEQILITHGTQQAIQLIAQLLICPGDAIALENPGYVSTRRIFESRGANILPIPVDEEGLQIEVLEQQSSRSSRSSLSTLEQLPQPRLVFVTPSHQFPSGALLSLPRRLRLLAWARAHQALILEDDYDSEYRYSSRPIPALQGLEPNAPVIYIGTFAKVLFPGLRIGYVVLPEAEVEGVGMNTTEHPPRRLMDIFAQARWHSDRHSSLLDQMTLTDFINEGHLDRHLRKMRLLYDRRRQVLVHALQDAFGERIQFWGESAGMHIMVRWQLPLTHSQIQARAQSVGVGLVDAQPHYMGRCVGRCAGRCAGRCVDREAECMFILGYAELEEDEIRLGVERLAKALLADI